MKKIYLSSFVALLLSSTTYSQVQIDKPIQLTGSTGQRSITNLEAPVNGTDAANKNYVDTKVAAGGGSVPWSNYQIFTTSGTFTVPADITSIKVQVWGGGGGGGGTNSSDGWGGGGGGAGGFAEGIYSVTASTSYSVTIGSGGNGGTTSSAGTVGGTSSFGSLIQATGGAGGRYAPNMGGQGGVGIGGYTSISLSGGNASNATSLMSYSAGVGGCGGGPRGGGGGGGNGGGNGGYVSNPGSNATGTTGGGGGGGGYASQPGGNGAQGQVIVYW